jgi:hypothetical protein
MLSLSKIEAIHALSSPDRQKRYLELCNKVVSYILLTQDELQEMSVLRESVQHDAEAMKYSRPAQ